MRKAIIAFLTLCVGFGAAVTGASAAQPSAPAMALNELTAKLAPATNATYRHYCVRQYFICRDRWGDSRQFSRCMKWRGCWEAYLDYRDRRDDDDNDNGYGCSRWREACAENWGYGNNDYYGCLRYHGCD